MFWERLCAKCSEMGTAPTPFVKSLGISHGIVTKWKNGALPNAETLIKLADGLLCSVDYLLGRSNIANIDEIKKVPSVSDERINLFFQLNEEDKDEIYNIMKMKLDKPKYNQDSTETA